ncbi:hypothetical protein FACS1894107_08550 [Planctomycetales bacterium]|nr:hypothetical protein FACS1894107_08550 [Planctomycetales bacterium]GHV19585.1 hypothetical protein AGMMS49959_05010 [Planctomycetales bacterium]
MIKRLADIAEKMGVAGLALGLFQGNGLGLLLGSVFVGICLYATYWLLKKEAWK